jgi:hypothetical protein
MNVVVQRRWVEDREREVFNQCRRLRRHIYLSIALCAIFQPACRLIPASEPGPSGSSALFQRGDEPRISRFCVPGKSDNDRVSRIAERVEGVFSSSA